MAFPRQRPRRLRSTPALRRLVAQTSLEPRHLVLPMGVFISDQTLSRLSESDRAMVREQARLAAQWERTMMAERNRAALTEMLERHGASLSQVDTAPLREKGRPIQDQVAEQLQVQALLASVREAGR